MKMETSEDGIVANTSSSFNTPPKPHDFERQVEANSIPFEGGRMIATSALKKIMEPRPKPRDWEEAMNQVIDDKHKLRCALLDILMAWNFNTGLAAVENALQRAKKVLDATDVDPS